MGLANKLSHLLGPPFPVFMAFFPLYQINISCGQPWFKVHYLVGVVTVMYLLRMAELNSGNTSMLHPPNTGPLILAHPLDAPPLHSSTLFASYPIHNPDALPSPSAHSFLLKEKEGRR